jgi:hypothetical protein
LVFHLLFLSLIGKPLLYGLETRQLVCGAFQGTI